MLIILFFIFTFGSKSIKIVDLSAEASPRSLLAFTMHEMNFLFMADLYATCKGGDFVPKAANCTVSSLRATVPRARLAS